ncbi:MAG TPA: hypothetical protein VFY92_09400 [Hyphomicrobiaceae bacterium]|nr:hypothetical protein [Hyphomicrobiaceae bacterium]
MRHGAADADQGGEQQQVERRRHAEPDHGREHGSDRETTSGLGSRSVISQPEAVLYIQLPMLETTVAIHSIEKVA